MVSSAYVWAKIYGYMEDQLGSIVISTFFDDVEVVDLTQDTLILYTGSDYRRDTIIARYTDIIHEALRTLFNSNAKLIVFSDEELDNYKSKGKSPSAMDFNPHYSFDNFVVGPSNRLAHGAALAVSNHPGDVYNPLFIYGPPGVGKTHLLYAIANSIKAKNPDTKIVYIKGDQFTTELIQAIQTGKNIEFRSKYREADLFLIDDIQFIAGKESTQEEFFHTFNKLYEEHKQIVMTSDRKPSDMLTLEDRLRSRFEWGLIADIQLPDYETRMAILKDKSSNMGLLLEEEVFHFLAANMKNSVRLLEGAVKKIMAYRDLDNMPLDLENVAKAVDDMIKGGANVLPTPNLIISQVCKFFSVDEAALLGSQKSKAVTEPRKIAMYLVRRLTNLSFPEIGQKFNKDHATVIYNVRQVERAFKEGNTELQNNIRDITANINSMLS